MCLCVAYGMNQQDKLRLAVYTLLQADRAVRFPASGDVRCAAAYLDEYVIAPTKPCSGSRDLQCKLCRKTCYTDISR
jgi:hypothetical protein